MNRLSYPQKFTLISLLFVLPLALVMFLLVSEIENGIDFARTEVAGDVYLRPLSKLLQDLPEHNRLAYAYLAGDVSVRRGDLLGIQSQIDDDVRSLESMDQRLGVLLKTSGRFDALRTNWQDLKDKLVSLSPGQSSDLHSRLIADVRALMSVAGDTSNLILDPELDSYYVMAAVLLELPEAQDVLAQLSFAGDRAFAQGAVAAEDKARLTVLGGLVHSNAETLKRGMGVAFGQNNGVREALAAPLQEYVAATEAFLAMLDREILGPEQIGGQRAAYRAAAARAEDASFQLWNRAIVELDALLHARMDRLSQQKDRAELFSLAILLFVVYLLAGFYLAVMRMVSSLDRASRRMVSGDMNGTVVLDNHDELGQVVISFNSVASRLKESEARARLLQTIAAAANEASTVEGAMQTGVDQVCRYTGWPIGHVYLVAEDSTDELVPAAIWHLEDPERFERFRQVTEATRLVRGVGMPGRVLASGKPAWITDVTKDTNFPRAKLASDIGARAALACPVLIGREVVGVLEFFAEQVAEPDEPLLELLANVGTQLGRVIERKREAALRVEAEMRVVRHELGRAREIQERLLPKRLVGWPGQVELGARFHSAREMSGDFYDVFELAPPAADGRPSTAFAPLQIAVGDVAGKSIPAALVMALARTTLRAVAQRVLDSQPRAAQTAVRRGRGGVELGPARAEVRSAPSPATTMRLAGGILHSDLGRRDFVACALAVVEPATAGQPGPRLTLVNAGQVPPLLCRDGRAEELDPPGEHLPLGVLSDPQYESSVVELRPGDVVLFATDGLPEAPRQARLVTPESASGGAGAVQQPRTGDPPARQLVAGDFFGFERLAASAAYWSAHAADADSIAAGVWNDVAEWSGQAADHDDMTLVVLRVLGV
jgi:serine phosphatase RsbU (regulator of sigma subunit)